MALKSTDSLFDAITLKLKSNLNSNGLKTHLTDPKTARQIKTNYCQKLLTMVHLGSPKSNS